MSGQIRGGTTKQIVHDVLVSLIVYAYKWDIIIPILLVCALCSDLSLEGHLQSVCLSHPRASVPALC